MVQYYTLEQAAQLLHTSPEKLKDMAKKGEVRAFQDRGTLRFRSQEIDELVRLKGLGSDPELQLGEALKAPPPKSGTGGGKSTTYAPPDHVTHVDPHESEAAIGNEPLSKTGSSRSGRSPRPRSGSPKSPPPKASSDSDVRLVSESSDLNFQIAPEGDVPVSKPPSAAGSGSHKGKTEAKADSGVRIVPLDKASDSDVKIVPDDSDVPLGGPKTKTPSDSDIRIEPHTPVGPKSGAMRGSDPALITEDIDLDAEEAARAKAQEAARARAKSKVHGKGKTPQPAKTSPFELSDSDLDVKANPTAKGATPPVQKKGDSDSSSDFELTPVGDSPIEPSSDEVPVLGHDDEVGLGEHHTTAGDSGINLADPADSGISLEKDGSDEIEFELAPEAGRTPQPGPLHVERDSSSEFELSTEGAAAEGDKPDSSSEFELSLDAAGEPAQADSDSEFELTLDDSGGLAAMDDSSSSSEQGEKDIFETDFEVPALEEESGSEAVALDEGTDLESSDFDVDVNESSGSQVVSLEDEPEVDETAETQTARSRRPSALLDDSGAGVETEGLEEGEEEEELVEGRVPATAAAAPAEWGSFPGIALLIGLPILFVVTLMGFEMLQTQHGYHKPGVVTGAIANMVGEKLPE
jgi:excisionase family DNA binding protein